MFWTGFASALILIAAARFLAVLRPWEAPEQAASRRARELLVCGLRWQVESGDEVAEPMWLYLAARHPEFGSTADFHLQRILLSGRETGEAWVEAYRALADRWPENAGLLYKLEKTLQNVERTVEARECWRRVVEMDDGGWRERAVEDPAATRS